MEAQAREEGLHGIFEEAGFQLRQPGCSACLGMNEGTRKYCISTSNRNFEGRQDRARVRCWPVRSTAAAAAVTGVVTDAPELLTVSSESEL